MLLVITFQIEYMEFVAALDDILIKFLILPVRGKKIIFIFKAWSHVRFPDCNGVRSGFLLWAEDVCTMAHFLTTPKSRWKKMCPAVASPGAETLQAFIFHKRCRASRNTTTLLPPALLAQKLIISIQHSKLPSLCSLDFLKGNFKQFLHEVCLIFFSCLFSN